MFQTIIDHPLFRRVRNILLKCAILIHTGLSLVSVLCCFVMLENSARPYVMTMLEMENKYILLNLLTIGIIWAVAFILCNRVWVSCLVSVFLCGIISIANYYVTAFHGMPLSFPVLKNFSTAMRVVSSYTLSLDPTVCETLVIMLVMTVLCVISGLVWKEKPRSGRGKWIRNALLAGASILVLVVGYTGENPIKPANTITWLWSEAYYTYGFAACTVESFHQSMNPVTKPDGYSDQSVQAVSIPAGEGQTATPDVILILNETFYDLRQIADFTTDIPYLSNIESMENALTGYAVVPMAGGATNSSEYELLTSNSMALMPGITPFNALDLYGANSIASHLTGLGYATTGAHSEPAVNYNRGQGYYGLGFQNTHFDTDFEDVEMYCSRFFETDQSLYRNMLRWYEESTEDVPRFQYLLTIQNHGAWDTNDPEHDLVHVQEDFGEYTDLMNEFLSCIYLSDLAFKELTEYYASVDRPVILCMVGDHCPTFASDIVDESYDDAQAQLRLRKVPLVVWANFSLEQTDLGTMSMNYVVPTLLDLAGIPMNSYYRYILQAKEQVPILTSYGVYYDAEGNLYRYEDPNAPCKQLTADYFNLEYYNIQNPDGSLLSD